MSTALAKRLGTVGTLALLIGCAGPGYYAAEPGPNPAAVAAHREAAAANNYQQNAVRQERAADRAAWNGNYAAAYRHEQAADAQNARAAQMRQAARRDGAIANSW